MQETIDELLEKIRNDLKDPVVDHITSSNAVTVSEIRCYLDGYEAGAKYAIDLIDELMAELSKFRCDAKEN